MDIISSSSSCNFRAIDCFIFKPMCIRLYNKKFQFKIIWNYSFLKILSLVPSCDFDRNSSILVYQYSNFFFLLLRWYCYYIFCRNYLYYIFPIDFHHAIFHSAMDFLSCLLNISCYGTCTKKLVKFLHFRGTINLYTPLY